MLKFLLGFVLALGVIASVAAWWLLSTGDSPNTPPPALGGEKLDKAPATGREGPLFGRIRMEFPEELKEIAKTGKLTKVGLVFFRDASDVTPPFFQKTIPVASDPQNHLEGRFPLFNRAFRENQEVFEGYFQMTACHSMDANSESCGENAGSWPRFFRGRSYFKVYAKNAKDGELDFGGVPLNVYHNEKESCKDDPAILKRKLVATESYKQKFPSNKFNYYLTVHIGPGTDTRTAPESGKDGSPMVIQQVNFNDPIAVDFSKMPDVRKARNYTLLLSACPKTQSDAACMEQAKAVNVFKPDGFWGQDENSRLIRLAQDHLHTINCTKTEQTLYANWFRAIDVKNGLFKLSEGLPKGMADGIAYY